MRRLLLAVGGLVAAMSNALAGGREVPILRGSEAYVEPPRFVQWGGFYAGAQVGYGFSSFDFADSTRDLIAHMLRNSTLETEQRPSSWQVLGRSDTHSGTAGFFFGYNSCWEDVVLGFDFNYNRSAFSTAAPVSPLFRVVSTSDGNVYALNVTGAATMRITDLAAVRARAGVAIDNFLPYMTIGAVAGRADLSRSATVSGTENGTDFSFSEAEVKNGAFIFGWSLGGGLDIMVMPNVFLRAEYEYMAFSPVWEIKANVQTVRVGGGLKF